MEAIFPIIWIGIFLGALLWIIYYHKAKREIDPRQALFWQQLAAANDLTLEPPQTWYDRARVVGQYRGHQVKITTFLVGENENNFQPYTRITLSVKDRTPNPDPKKVGEIVRLFTEGVFREGASFHLETKLETKERQFWRYEQPGLELKVAYLQSMLDLLASLADAYPTILRMGGKIVPPLDLIPKRYGFWTPVITQLLKDIAQHTETYLEPQLAQLWCPHCQMHYGQHKIKLPEFWQQSVRYYGCRHCQDSQDYWLGPVVAVLDEQMTEERLKQVGVVQVNWLTQRQLFDFDQVAIKAATDEQVERFAVQIGNDTDTWRRPRYRQMRCRIAPTCQLSENTLRILRRTFGQVVQVPVPAANEEAHA